MVGSLLYEGRPSHDGWACGDSCGWPRLLGPASGSAEYDLGIVAGMLPCADSVKGIRW